MKQAFGRMGLAVLLLAVWLLLTLPFALPELMVGALVALLVAFLPLPDGELFAELPVLPKRILFAVIYLGVFLVAVIKSNMDVALRVLNPRLPINPGIVRVKTRLKSRLGRLILANSITLTPGTITVDIDGEDLFIHWLSVTSPDLEANTRQIVGGFEKYLEVIFG